VKCSACGETIGVPGYQCVEVGAAWVRIGNYCLHCFTLRIPARERAWMWRNAKILDLRSDTSYEPQVLPGMPTSAV
jgi:hypothetical protein